MTGKAGDAAPELWRIVLASGDVLEAPVYPDTHEYPWIVYTASDDFARGATPRAAVTRLAGSLLLEVVEILAPGEPTRADLKAEAAKQAGAAP